MTPEPSSPNHHADHAGFSGPTGLIAALSMLVRRRRPNELICDLIDLEPSDRLVDIGCGPGSTARVAASRGAEVVGVEPAPLMLSLARRFTWARAGRPRFIEGRAEALPLGNGWATGAWALATVHHWPDLDGGLAETHRVLSPGGRFLVAERRIQPGANGRASHGWTDDQVTRFVEHLAAAGFADIERSTHQSGRIELQVVLSRKA
jgi:ubiquinone/menaquinone biosynthesis C-methylase UbiE